MLGGKTVYRKLLKRSPIGPDYDSSIIIFLFDPNSSIDQDALFGSHCCVFLEILRFESNGVNRISHYVFKYFTHPQLCSQDGAVLLFCNLDPISSAAAELEHN
eukprot:scaffold7_cov132-Cylindrotheca_fusiformis.AAC.1